MKKENILDKYPWLKITTTLEDYVKPNYYDKLIKEYGYKGKSDLDYTIDYLKGLDKNIKNVLELGSGTGRATKIIDKILDYKKLTLVDLSPQMIEILNTKWSDKNKVKIIKSDHLNFMKETTEKYNLALSLWSFSHSVHQHFDKYGGNIDPISKIINKFVDKNLEKNSYIYIIHFDTLSEEQRILTKQWIKVFPVFKEYYNKKMQSPSKQLLDKIFNNLSENKKIEYECEHIIGDAIRYKNMDEALEVFMNFHLESYFNNLDIVEDVVGDLENDIKKYKISDGSIKIKPGFFIYKIKKL